ncbi:MAG: 2TM domain-containing protein [Proteobacteria bacterium]|nr:2TM domain-containing protein [Pseudomonadota bacterium]
MLQEKEVRQKVKVLKRFYLDVVYFGVVNVLLALIWLTFDRTGTFWPKYVIVVWGVTLVFRAYRMGVIPLIFHRTTFLSEEWEEKKVRALLRRRTHHQAPPIDKDHKKK